jgi:excisionase family DNA binding protein
MRLSHGTISIAETARKLRVGLAYAYSLIWSGKLPAEKKEGRWQIPMAAVEDYIKSKGRVHAGK